MKNIKIWKVKFGGNDTWNIVAASVKDVIKRVDEIKLKRTKEMIAHEQSEEGKAERGEEEPIDWKEWFESLEITEIELKASSDY